jgi:virulence factor Mce-like protein
MSRRRIGVIALTAAIVATGLAGCSRPGDGGYHLQASFPRAVALYAQSRVKVMGIDVGRVTSVKVKPDHVEVQLLIDRDVPLPDDVEASIVPLSLIGERNIVLSPPWKPGDAKAQDGHVIPAEKTHVPVEPDEALQAITDLAKAIDPAAVQKLVSGGAAALAGHGSTINDALDQASQLTQLLASQDQRLLSIAQNFHALASALQSRQDVLGKLLDDFAATTNVLASERDSIVRFLHALDQLTQSGQVLLESYQTQLPQDVASLASVVLTLQVNAGSIQQVIQAVDNLGQGVIDAYDPQSGGAKVRITGTPTVLASIQAIFDLLGLGPAPCVELGGVKCP